MEERIGSVIKFFDKTSIAAVKLEFGDLSVGDTGIPDWLTQAILQSYLDSQTPTS